ncbi:hypothetical protein PENARI_c031G11406 [Penicillium arizonense]|uniref:Terrelysin n=1 Tax=Penicillium arizonense TaxID=1835702 RepID=A0A1F5L5B5_PENAI|nr:hypothetical protein PENARI_c031G11406 [Penicillium arizonense]OGE48170.1 hypothetical protein PENARI_c031G11406 [Penicillium arizonense]
MTSAFPDQNLQIRIQDDLKYDIRIENADIHSGQFYNEDDRSDILTAEDVDDMVIRHNGGMRSICSTNGSEGSVDLVDDVKDARICSLAWRASTQPGERIDLKKLNHNERYMVEIGNRNESGTIPVTIKEQS